MAANLAVNSVTSPISTAPAPCHCSSVAGLSAWGSGDNHLSPNLLWRRFDLEGAGKHSLEGLLMTTSLLNGHILTIASIPNSHWSQAIT